MKNIKTKLGNWMMAMSLLLLGTFLGFYLFSTYVTEKERIEREMGYIFTNSIKEIESKLMGNLIKVSNKGNNQISINIDHMPKNNVAVFTSKTEIKKSGKKEIRLNNRIERRKDDIDDDKEVSGMLSVMLKIIRQDSPDGILKLQQTSNLKTI
ncbi:MAG: hypothetical protein K9I84_10750, partial [Leadbetterella sp.]|nr:hypothetical protein [Leadbetterella sp.]